MCVFWIFWGGGGGQVSRLKNYFEIGQMQHSLLIKSISWTAPMKQKQEK